MARLPDFLDVVSGTGLGDWLCCRWCPLPVAVAQMLWYVGVGVVSCVLQGLDVDEKGHVIQVVW